MTEPASTPTHVNCHPVTPTGTQLSTQVGHGGVTGVTTPATAGHNMARW